MTISFETAPMSFRPFLLAKRLYSITTAIICLLVSLQAYALDTSQYHAQPKYAFAMHGQPKYPKDFKHLDYVNPDAPKGGELRQGVVSNGYDSFNGFILKGFPAEGLGMLYDTLAYSSEDEPFTEYGLVAEKIEMPKDRSWVRFYINHKAHFNDGVPITAEDVKFTFDTLMDKGSPSYKVYYSDVKEAIVESKYKILFLFKTNKNKELPLILGQLPVLPEHYWKNKDFNKTTLTPPLGSGPYKIKSFEPGRNIVYEREPNYWGKDLPVNVGRFNFNKIDFEYFGDQTIALEAFKAGRYDVRLENVAKSWATSYKGEKFDKGIIKKEEVRNKRPTGMQAFIFNTRRDVFKQPQVREALNYAFDFEWTNKQLFFSQYTRTTSYFDNSDLASSGLPSPAELKILAPYKSQLPHRLFTQPFKVPVTNGSGNIRGNLRIAMGMLHKAGWHVKNGQLTNDKTGKPLKFEILLYSKAFERVVLPFVKNLHTLGIQATVRLVDTNQYIQRLRNFDYDMIIMTIPEGNSPGNEQKNYWTSQSADIQGSHNYAGIKNPVVDDLVKDIVSADDRKDLVNYTRALDRVLLWNFYVIPQWHIEIDRVAYWNKLHHPAKFSDQGVNLDSWWSSPDSGH
jgi:microcin C transport system substrate-binding protein